MDKRLGAGAAAGLAGGFVLEWALRILPAYLPGRGLIPSTLFVSRAAHAAGQSWSWLVLPLYGLAVGVVFGLLFPAASQERHSAVLRGTLYGVAWGIVAGLVILPLLAGDGPLSPAAIAFVRPVAFPLVIGHVVAGIVLSVGSAFALSWLGRERKEAARPSSRRAA